MKKVLTISAITLAVIAAGFGATALYKNMPYFGVVHYVPAAVNMAVNSASDSVSSLFKKEMPPSVTLTFAGDIMLDRGVERSVIKNFAGDFSPVFKNAAPFFAQDDITFLNLEGPVSDKGHNVGSIYSFEMDPEVLPVIKNASIDIVSFANNHVGDYTKAAFVDTMERLTENGIPFAGAGKTYEQATTPTIIEKNGLKVGFLAFTDVGPNWLAAKHVETDNSTGTAGAGILLASDPNFSQIISSAKTKVDVLVVSFHWGIEYKAHTERQTKLAHTAIDNGADIIVGAHPHVPQDLETYKDKLIMYSLGNFVFDQYFSKETMQGLVVRTTATKDVATGAITISNTTEYINKLDKNYTIESITEKNPPPKTSNVPAEISIGWTGDIPPSRTVPQFDAVVLTHLQSPDIMAGNLEGALANTTATSQNTDAKQNAKQNAKCGSGAPNCYSFVGSSAFAQALHSAGFDIVNLANNHALDKGVAGVANTKTILTTSNLLYSPENGELTIVNVKGTDVAFLSFGHNAWTAKITELQKVRKMVKSAAAQYSVVVVLFHGGAEGVSKTHVTNAHEYYIGEDRGNAYAFAHTAIDAGADLVLGSGPHVVRGIEKYSTGLIVYSAGNFLTTEGMNSNSLLGKAGIFTMTIDQNGILKHLNILSTSSQAKNSTTVDDTNETLSNIITLTKQDFNQTISADQNGDISFY